MSRSHSRFFRVQKSILSLSITKYYFPPKVTNPTIGKFNNTPFGQAASDRVAKAPAKRLTNGLPTPSFKIMTRKSCFWQLD